jgi:hypothetical protein
VKSQRPQVHTFDHAALELVGVLELACGDDHRVEVEDDLTDADSPAVGSEVGDAG